MPSPTYSHYSYPSLLCYGSAFAILGVFVSLLSVLLITGRRCLPFPSFFWYLFRVLTTRTLPSFFWFAVFSHLISGVNPSPSCQVFVFI